MPPRENVPTSYAGCPLQRSPSDPITFDGITPSTRTAFWWRNFLPSWKGRSFFYDDKWTPNHILIFTPTYASLASVLISQATGSTGHPRPRRPLYRSVMFKELFAITAAVYTWAASFACRNILLHCDSLPVVSTLWPFSVSCFTPALITIFCCVASTSTVLIIIGLTAVADPDLQKRGGPVIQRQRQR